MQFGSSGLLASTYKQVCGSMTNKPYTSFALRLKLCGKVSTLSTPTSCMKLTSITILQGLMQRVSQKFCMTFTTHDKNISGRWRHMFKELDSITYDRIKSIVPVNEAELPRKISACP